MRARRRPGFLTSQPPPHSHWRRLGCLPPRLRMRLVSSKMPGMRQCALRPRPAPPGPTGCFPAAHLETPAGTRTPEPSPVPAPSLPGWPALAAAHPQGSGGPRVRDQPPACAGAAIPGGEREPRAAARTGPPSSGSGKPERCVQSSISSRASQHLTRLQTWKRLPVDFQAWSQFPSACSFNFVSGP